MLKFRVRLNEKYTDQRNNLRLAKWCEECLVQITTDFSMDAESISTPARPSLVNPPGPPISEIFRDNVLRLIKECVACPPGYSFESLHRSYSYSSDMLLQQ